MNIVLHWRGSPMEPESNGFKQMNANGGVRAFDTAETKSATCVVQLLQS